MNKLDSEYEWSESGLLVPKNTNSSQKGKQSGSLLTIILTAIPSLGFLAFILAYLHEIGFTSRFGLPIELIRLDSTFLQLAYIGPSLILTFSFGLTALVYFIITISKKLLLNIVAFLNLIFTPIFLYASFREYLGNNSAFVTIGLLVMQLVILMFITFNRNANRKLDEKMKNITRGWPIWIVISILCLSAFSYVAGTTDVSFQREYLVPSSENSSVVLRIYGDNVICAPLVDNANIDSSYFILKINEPGLKLSQHKFDSPLYVKK